LGSWNFALGDAIGGRSRDGKFIRRIEAELLDQLRDNAIGGAGEKAHGGLTGA
jgi:hypothetical protein